MATAECLELHQSLVKEVTKLIHSVFSAPKLGIHNLVTVLKRVYQDDIFMMYDTMHSMLGELKNLDEVQCK